MVQRAPRDAVDSPCVQLKKIDLKLRDAGGVTVCDDHTASDTDCCIETSD